MNTQTLNDLIEYKCLCCNKNYQCKFDEKLKEQFFNTYKFSNLKNNKFILLLQKGVFPYEYKNDWVKFNETSLPEKGDFYSHLNIEDADYMHAKYLFWDKKFRRISWFVCSKWYIILHFTSYILQFYEYIILIRNLKQALNHGLVLKKVQKVIKFNQNTWLKLYIDMNTDIRKKQEMI